MGSHKRTRGRVRRIGIAVVTFMSLVFTVSAGPCQAAVMTRAGGDTSGSGVPVIVHRARTIQWDSTRRILTATGQVDAQYGNYRIRADTLTYSDSSRRMTARGHVRVKSPSEQFIRGSYFSVLTRTNEVTIRRAQMDGKRWRINARKVTGDADTELIMSGGTFTTCRLKTPHYDVKASSVYVYPGDRIVAYHNFPRLMEVPFFYWPYLSIDLQGTPRWEFEPGVSDRNGVQLGVTYHYLMKRDNWPITGSLYADFNQESRPGAGLDVNYDNKWGGASMFYFQSNRRPLLSDTDGRKFRADETEQMYRFRSDVNMRIPDSRWSLQGDVDWSSDQRLEPIEFSNFSMGRPSRRTLEGAVSWRGSGSYFSVRARREDRAISDGNRERFVRNTSVLPRIQYSLYATPVSWLSNDLYYSLSATGSRVSRRDTGPYRLQSQVGQSLSRTFPLLSGVSQKWQIGYRHQYNEVSRGSGTTFESIGSGLFTLENTIRPFTPVSISLKYDLEKRFNNRDSVPLSLNNRDLGFEAHGFRSHAIRWNSSWNGDVFYANFQSGYDLRELRTGSIDSDSRVISPLLNLSTQLTTTLSWDQFFRYDWGNRELDQLNTTLSFEPTRHLLTSLGWDFNQGRDRDFSQLRNRFKWRYPAYGFEIQSDLVYDMEKDKLDETRLRIYKQLHEWGLNIYYRDIRNDDYEVSLTLNLLDESTDQDSSGGETSRGFRGDLRGDR